MMDDDLDSINVIKHRIELLDETAALVHFALFITELNSRHLEKTGTQKKSKTESGQIYSNGMGCTNNACTDLKWNNSILCQPLKI